MSASKAKQFSFNFLYFARTLFSFKRKRFPPPARLRRAEQAGKNSFPQTPFLFARLLGLRPEIF